MKILLVGHYLNDQQQSMLRFAKVLSQELISRGYEVRLIRPQPYFGRLKPSAVGLGKWLGYIDKFLIFPLILKKEIKWPDIIHICDHSLSIYLTYCKNKFHVITCNDLLAIRSARGEFDESRVKITGRIYQSLILKNLRAAKNIACISQETKKDFIGVVGESFDILKVIYMGFNYPYHPMDHKKAATLLNELGISGDMPYFIHVGNNSWYKNKRGLIEIYSYLLKYREFSNNHMIFVGSISGLEPMIQSLGLETRVTNVTDIDNQFLCALYSNAQALIFPSLNEGFGWPIVEAQACGCPVFASNRSPMTEIGGDAAVYFDPKNPELAAKCIYDNLSRLKEMGGLGIKNSDRFTTRKMIDDYEALYKKILSQ